MRWIETPDKLERYQLAARRNSSVAEQRFCKAKVGGFESPFRLHALLWTMDVRQAVNLVPNG